MVLGWRSTTVAWIIGFSSSKGKEPSNEVLKNVSHISIMKMLDTYATFWKFQFTHQFNISNSRISFGHHISFSVLFPLVKFMIFYLDKL